MIDATGFADAVCCTGTTRKLFYIQHCVFTSARLCDPQVHACPPFVFTPADISHEIQSFPTLVLTKFYQKMNNHDLL